MEENKKDLSESVKKLLQAGMDVAAATKEKSKEIFGDLVKKGEQAVNQNETLKEKLNEAGELAKSAGEKAKSTLKETADRFAADQFAKGLDFSELLDRLTPEQLAALKEQIALKEAEPAEEELFCEASQNISEEEKAEEEEAEESCCCSEEKAEDEGCCCSEEKAEEGCCSEEKAEESCCSEEKAEEGCCSEEKAGESCDCGEPEGKAEA